MKLKHFLPLAALFLFAAGGKIKEIPRTQLIYLSMKGPASSSLTCFLTRGKPTIATIVNSTEQAVLVRPALTKASQRKLQQRATAECKRLSRSPACSNGRDDDGDGLRDFPNDPDCQGNDGTSESSSSAPSVPTPASGAACADGVDNDNDGFTDYPHDVGCQEASDASESAALTGTSVYRVFRKPFAGQKATLSIFDHQFALQFIHTDGVIVSAFNEKRKLGLDGHQGYDFDLEVGVPVLASYDGEVILAGEESAFFCPLLNKTTAGLAVLIRHTVQDKTFNSAYVHLSRVDVSLGEKVSAGRLLGLSGNTGCSTQPHLHFDIREVLSENPFRTASVDPFGWNSSESDPWSTHPSGVESRILWASDEVPEIYFASSLSPNPNPGDRSPLAITSVRWSTLADNPDPNAEFVQIELDPRYATGTTMNIGKYKVKNNAGVTYTFPGSTVIRAGTPVRLYSGSGSNTETAFFWGRSSEVWSNDGDCVQLFTDSDFRTYRYDYGGQGCPVP